MTAVVYFIWLFSVPYLSFCEKENVPSTPSEDLSLLLVHVVRHGNRTANGPEELYPKDPYLNETYFPFGLGQLTNEGKRKEYSIGKALRERYGQFFGTYYFPAIVDAWSTDFNRTKMSLELVLASLFPPKGEMRWNLALNWQPIPYNYLPIDKDKILQGTRCPNYLKLYAQHVQSKQQQTEFNKYKETFEYISNNTGLNITSFVDVYRLYFGLSTEEEWGLKLPKWTKPVWPEIVTELAVKEYSVATATTDLRRLTSGGASQMFDMVKANGEFQGTKIYLYSAHESNIANLLILLGIFEPPRVPSYGAYLIFEVHKINNTHGIKIYYENYVSGKPHPLKLPGCELFCEINKFITLTEEYIPSPGICGT